MNKTFCNRAVYIYCPLLSPLEAGGWDSERRKSGEEERRGGGGGGGGGKGKGNGKGKLVIMEAKLMYN